ncbi:MAG: hypothetical protein R2697_19445 [Ilumatobacteraceae bacterium]
MLRHHPDIRDACGGAICGHVPLEADIADALAAAGSDDEIRADDLARFTQVVLRKRSSSRRRPTTRAS